MPGKITDLTPKDVAGCGQPVLLYNAVHKQWVFVSNDKKGPDQVVESHPYPYRVETRNQFVLQPVGKDRYRLYNPDNKHWVFVSDDKDATDHQVESHPYPDEERNTFEFQNAGNGQYLIYNPSCREYIFVSSVKEGIDHLVLSHPHGGEERNKFSLEILYDVDVTKIEYDFYHVNIEAPVPFVLETETITNKSSSNQEMSFNMNKSVSQTSIFEYTSGIRLGTGFTFSVGVPGIMHGEARVDIDINQEFTWGKETTTSKSFSSNFKLVGMPHTKTVGNVIVQRCVLDVPYKMTLKTRDGKNLYSHGIWRGVSHWNLQLDVDSCKQT